MCLRLICVIGRSSPLINNSRSLRGVSAGFCAKIEKTTSIKLLHISMNICIGPADEVLSEGYCVECWHVWGCLRGG